MRCWPSADAFFDWDPSGEEQRRRRSLYIFQRRNLVLPMMEAFDAADMSESCARRGASVPTPQVFTLFNSRFAHEISRHFAARVLREAGAEPRPQVARVFRLALGRSPRPEEQAACEHFLGKQLELLQEQQADDEAKAAPGALREAALADLCLVAINSNEFLYLE